MDRRLVACIAAALTASLGAVAAAQQGLSPQDPSMNALGSVTPAPAAPPQPASPSVTYLPRRGPECQDFRRGPDGGWIATAAVTFPAPNGPLKLDPATSIRPGQLIGGYDLAAILQRDCPSTRAAEPGAPEIGAPTPRAGDPR